jgi:hypothetical protein
VANGFLIIININLLLLLLLLIIIIIKSNNFLERNTFFKLTIPQLFNNTPLPAFIIMQRFTAIFTGFLSCA